MILLTKYMLIINLLFCSFALSKSIGVSRDVSGFFILNKNQLITAETDVSVRNVGRPMEPGESLPFLLSKTIGGSMKQNRKPVKQEPVVKEVAIHSISPLGNSIDQLFEVMQLLECQYDSLNGVASLHPDLSHQTYLNMVISQKVQDSYETIDGFLKELHDREGVVL